jgi:hypothetical protein
MVAAEAHAVDLSAPWYAPTGRNVAIHRYFDTSFVKLYQADVAAAPPPSSLFDWEAEDRMADQGGVLKLRRPSHKTFHIVAWQASCLIANASPGLPALAAEKIASVGFVIRTGDPAAPQGFMVRQGKPWGWDAVDPKADPDAAKQLKALGLLPRAAAPNLPYTGEETFPLHPLAAQDGQDPRTLLFGYLPLGGDYLPPTPPLFQKSDMPEELSWPFGLYGLAAAPASYAQDAQINAGAIKQTLGALLRVLIGRYQLAGAGAWTDQTNQNLVSILDGLYFFADPPANLSGQALRDFAAANRTDVSLGSALRDQARAQALLVLLIENTVNGSVTLDQAEISAKALRGDTAPTTAAPAKGFQSLLVPEQDAARFRAALADRLVQAANNATKDTPAPKYVSGPNGRYFLAPFVRVLCPNGCEKTFWGKPSEPFAVAAHFDPDAARPTLIEMPDLTDAMKGAAKGAIFDMPRNLADLVNGLTNSSAVQKMWNGGGGPSGGLGIRFICSFSLPAITICAMLMLSIVLCLLNIFLGWMAWVKICIPLPSKTSGGGP